MTRTTLAIAVLALLAACGSGSQVTLVGNDVQVKTTQLDITFARGDKIAETYMIFGGLSSDRDDMASKITLVGLPMTEARAIYADYPDFDQCSSAGAEYAKAATRQLDIVPVNGAVLATLEHAFAQSQDNLQTGGGRVSVALTGAVLSWKSAKVGGEEVLQQLPPQIKREHVLVETAHIVDTSMALPAPQ